MSLLAQRRNAARERVLDAMSDGAWWYGLDLLRATRMRSGRLYPVLDALEREGVIEAAWDDSGPRRRVRRLVQ